MQSATLQLVQLAIMVYLKTYLIRTRMTIQPVQKAFKVGDAGQNPLAQTCVGSQTSLNNGVLLIAEAVLDFEDAAIGQENVTRRRGRGSSAVSDESPPIGSDAQKSHSSGSYSQPYARPKKLS